jgi:hypothetical protein
MKKFLLLMLVLGLTSFASAGVIPDGTLLFTVNGEEQPAEVWLEPSEVIELDLELLQGHNVLALTFDYVLSNAQAELITDGASGSYPDIEEVMTDIEFPTEFMFAGSTPIVEPQRVRITMGNLTGPVEGPAVLMKELYVHCLEATDVILEILVGSTSTIDGVTYTAGEPLHTLIIHQIPEPMTIALLGLGGLFALRRRKK